MHKTTVSRRMSLKLLDSLYVEAMVMADEARAYFDQQGDRDREEMDIMLRVSFSIRSEEHTSELQSLMRISYAVSCLNKTKFICYSSNIISISKPNVTHNTH